MVSPERSSPHLGTGGSWVYAKDNFLVSVLTSTHTREEQRRPARGLWGEGTSLTGSRRGTAGSGRGCGGREQEVGGGVLGLSLPPPYFRHLTPSAKRAVPPRRRRRLMPAGLGGSALAGRARALAPPAALRGRRRRRRRLPGPLTAARARLARPAPHPTRSPLPAPGPRPVRPPPPLPSAATHALCEPLALSPGPRSQRRLALPPGRCYRRHGGPAATAAAAAPAGLHACLWARFGGVALTSSVQPRSRFRPRAGRAGARPGKGRGRGEGRREPRGGAFRVPAAQTGSARRPSRRFLRGVFLSFTASSASPRLPRS